MVAMVGSAAKKKKKIHAKKTPLVFFCVTKARNKISSAEVLGVFSFEIDSLLF
jgi:hypothetical protein